MYPLFTCFEHLPTSIGIDTLIEYMTKYKLLPNDALIAATCRAYGIENIATFDEDFGRVPWLKTVKGT
ncbi:PIN domain-containing protein [Pyrodictium abyssi]|uniref:PIN domain-containing protein n=1 Tax=Pyrodictium abyssi TaxID=54256 RepID=UPI003B987774